jgi:hypothetical protein
MGLSKVHLIWQCICSYIYVLVSDVDYHKTILSLLLCTFLDQTFLKTICQAVCVTRDVLERREEQFVSKEVLTKRRYIFDTK